MRQSIINKLNSNSMSKKVIEPVIIEQSDGSKIEITPYGSDFLLVIQEERPINILNDNRTTVAKAICPEYQKVIDQNAKLFEALECLYNAIPNDGSYNYQSAMDNAYRIMQNHKKCN